MIYDIESSGLKGDFANAFCFGYMYHGDKRAAVISTLDVVDPCKTCKRVDTAQDHKLMELVYNTVTDADMVVSWYGKGFDWKFLNTRMLEAGLPPLPNIPHLDLYYTAKHNLALTSNRLANVQEFLRLPTAKTQLTKRVWRKAQAGHVDAIKYIIDHCAKDVLVLDQAYQKLKPYVRQHPWVGERDHCAVCGGTLEKRGFAMTITKGARRRFQCQQCGRWETKAA
jgi:uncharacterized protein YprB with RNaseH-like and TPR domain